jgi:hypothetical protein
VNRVVTAFRDAVFLASADFRARQNRYAIRYFQAPDATYLDASTATGALACVNDGDPLRLHDQTPPLEITTLT